MRWKGLLLLSLGLVLAGTAACGQGQDGLTPGAPGGESPSAPVAPGPPSPPTPELPRKKPFTPPPDGQALPAAQIDAGALPEGYPHGVWVSADGRTLYIRAQEGGCGSAHADVRQQTPERVTVNLVEDKVQTLQMCTQDIRYPVVSASLAEPLGPRTVKLTAEVRPHLGGGRTPGPSSGN